MFILACLHVACVITQKDYKQWFAELNTDLDKVLEVTKYILNLYEMWKNFEEKKEMPDLYELIFKSIKPIINKIFHNLDWLKYRNQKHNHPGKNK